MGIKCGTDMGIKCDFFASFYVSVFLIYVFFVIDATSWLTNYTAISFKECH
jgi:hypothetical protein